LGTKIPSKENLGIFPPFLARNSCNHSIWYCGAQLAACAYDALGNADEGDVGPFFLHFPLARTLA